MSNDDEQTLKIKLLSQWKLEAEVRKKEYMGMDEVKINPPEYSAPRQLVLLFLCQSISSDTHLTMLFVSNEDCQDTPLENMCLFLQSKKQSVP